MTNGMANGAIQLNFPWWYPFVKWLLPIGLAFGAALWVGLSLVGIIPIPVSFGMISWAPVFFSQLDTVAAVGVFIATTGVIASTIGVLSSLFVRGLLLTTAENVAVVRQVNAVYLEKDLQRHIEDSKKDLEHAQNQLVNEGLQHTDTREVFVSLKRAIEMLIGKKITDDGDELLSLRPAVVFNQEREAPSHRSGRSPHMTHAVHTKRPTAPTIDIVAANSDLAQDSDDSSEIDVELDGEASASPSLSRSSSPK